MKKAKLVKQALATPHLYSPEELAYFRLWLRAKKLRKQEQKTRTLESLGKLYLS